MTDLFLRHLLSPARRPLGRPQCFDVVFGSSANVVVSAPTSCGKTTIFELAVVALLQQPALAGAKIGARGDDTPDGRRAGASEPTDGATRNSVHGARQGALSGKRRRAARADDRPAGRRRSLLASGSVGGGLSR